MEFGEVSATPYCNYFLRHILLLHVFCRTMWNLVEYKLLFPVAILYCISTTRYCISYVFHEVLLTKLPIFDYSYGYSEKYSWLYQLLLSLKYFLWVITNKIESCWVLAVISYMAALVLLSNSKAFLIYSLERSYFTWHKDSIIWKMSLNHKN